jgi:hypothetical protein
MSTVVTKNVQVGTSGTAAQNFTLYQPASPDGTVRLANGNSGTTTDLVTVTSAGNVGIGTSSPGAKLMAYAAAGTSISLNNSSTGTSASSGFQLQTGSTTDAYIWNYSNGPLVIATNNIERIRVNANGIVATPFQPAFYADAYPYSAAQTRTSGVVFNSSTTANFSTVTNNGSHFNTSTGRFTAPVAGRYFFVGQYSRSGGNATTGIRVNGGTIYSQNLSYGTDWQTGSSSAVFSLNANDYVEFMYGATNATTTSSYTVNFGGYLIG